jgi:hypothetical protein
MSPEVACKALRAGKVLELRYDGYVRALEVHAVGYSKQNSLVMRAWQRRQRWGRTSRLEAASA